MGVYWYWFNVLMTPVYRVLFPGKRNEKIFYLVVCLHIFIVLSLRANDWGADAFQYYRVYRDVSELSFIDLMSKWSFLHQMRLATVSTESGYATMNWIFSHVLGLPYHVYLMFLAFIDCLVMYKLLRAYSAAPLLGTMIFQSLVFRHYLFIHKRITAMNIIFWAFLEIKEKHYTRAFFITIFAMMMHRSSIVFLIYPLLSQIKITKKLFFNIFLVAFLFLLFSPIFFNLVLNFAQKLDRASNFSKTDAYIFSFGPKKIFLLLIALAVYFIVDFKKLNADNKLPLCWVLLFCFSILPINILAILLNQLIFTFGPLIFILAINIAMDFKDRYIKNICWLILFAATIVITNMVTQSIMALSPFEGWGTIQEFKFAWDSSY